MKESLTTQEAPEIVNEATRERNIDTIKSFFELMHQRKLDEWNDLWDDHGFIYVPYPVASFPDMIRSKKAIAEGFEKLFAGFKSFDYRILDIYPSLDPNIIIVEYSVSAVLLKTGSIYNGRNIAVFKFRDGKINGYHDYFNPEKFKMVIDAIS